MRIVPRRAGRGRPTTPDTLEQLLNALPAAPEYHEVDHVLLHAAQVLDVLQANYVHMMEDWRPKRRWKVRRDIEQSIAEVEGAVRALVVHQDARLAVARLTAALPLLRRAWAGQMLSGI